MTSLTIRDIPDSVHKALHEMANRDGLSLETEALQLLTMGCRAEKQPASILQDLVDELYQGERPTHFVEELLQERRAEAKKE